MIRGVNRNKSQQACQKWSKSLPIVLSYHIINGENAEKGEFPHMAALGFYIDADDEYLFNCGGTIISEQYILTAAHCVINVQESELKIVRVGIIKLPASLKRPDPSLDLNVKNVTVHPDYKWKEKLNDIALVKLEKKLTWTDSIKPACLYTKTDEPTPLMVTGWGALGLTGEKSDILQKAILSPWSLNDCNNTYLSTVKKIVTRNQICAADEESDACQGDSGGPLQIQETGKSIFTVVGITSFGMGCGSKYPGVYTRVASYVDWIENIVW